MSTSTNQNSTSGKAASPKMFVATPEQIEAWKAEHGAVFRFKSAEYDKSAYFRKPTRKDMSFISGVTDPTEFNAMLLKLCFLAGDIEIQTNDDIFLGLGEDIIALVQFAKTEVEKL